MPRPEPVIPGFTLMGLVREFTLKRTKKPPHEGAANLNNLAATYSHMAYRHTTIGATMFHFRVRNGTGWFHCAMATRILISVPPSMIVMIGLGCELRTLVTPLLLKNQARSLTTT